MGRLYPNEIQRILYSPGGDVGKYARRVALEIAAESKRLAESRLGKKAFDKPRTGRLARSYRVTVIPNTNTFRVSNPTPYYDAIELGVLEAHEIRARRVEYLQFTDRHGRKRKVKMVHHPGNPAFNLMRDAAEAVMKRRFGTFRRA